MSAIVETRRLPSLSARPGDAHKGDFGRVLVVAGSLTMPGAAILAARSALRSGAGLVTVASDERVGGTIAAACVEATQLLLPRRDEESLASWLDANLSIERLARFDALVIGPGLGTDGAARAIVKRALKAPCPQVVDADALNLIAAGLDVTRRDDRVWTPHPGELERLTGARPRDPEARVRAAAELVARLGGVTVLKGRRTVVARADTYFVNPSGNPGLATGGSGDVLSGVIGALVAQGLNAFDSASLGVYLHGLAGDLAARETGETGLIASDLIERLPAAFRARHRAVRPPKS